MKQFRCWTVVAALCCSNAAFGQLPSWDSEQRAVWEFVEASWVDEAAENERWPENYVHPKVVLWGDEIPAPRGRDQLIRWTRFRDAGSAILYYDITPAAIVVVGDTAVVHYHSNVVTEDAKGERERSVNGLVETLVREGGTWKFVSLSGFEPKLNDD